MTSICRLGTLFLSLFAFSLPVHAQTIEDGRYWLNLIGEGDISKNLRWYMELQPRFKQEGRDFDQYLVRPGINYQISDKASIGGGYAYVRTSLDRGYSNEDRFWQQLTYNSSWQNGITFTSRSRLEQRLLDTGDDTGLRYRQLLRASKPLTALPRLSLLLWNELFVNFKDTDWGAESGFDQNRLFAGAAWNMRPDARLEFGYINQYVRGSRQDSMNHVLSTTFLFNF